MLTEEELQEHMERMLAYMQAKEVKKMPAKSKAQSKFLNMKKGHKWVKAHHFGNSTKGLPQKVKKKS